MGYVYSPMALAVALWIYLERLAISSGDIWTWEMGRLGKNLTICHSIIFILNLCVYCFAWGEVSQFEKPAKTSP
jgi:hypothetical protein